MSAMTQTPTTASLQVPSEGLAAHGQPAGLAPLKSTLVKSTLVKALLALALGGLIYLVLEPGNGLTQEGITALAVIVPTIIMWLTISTSWPSLLFLGLLAVTGVMTPNAIWAGSFGNNNIALIIIYSLLANVLAHTGVIDSIAAWFITRPVVKGRPYMFLAMFFASNLAIGLVMQNLALAVIYYDLAVKIGKKIGIGKGHSLFTVLILSVIWANGVLSVASPIAKIWPNVMINMMYEQLGVTVSYAQWLAVGIPYTLVMFAVMMLCARLIKPDVSPLRRLDVDQISQDTAPMSVQGKISLWTMIALVAFTVVPDFMITFGLGLGFATWASGLGVTIPAVFAISLLCVTRVKGQPVMDFNQATKQVSYSMWLFVAAIIVMGVPVGAESAGIGPWLGHLFSPIAALPSLLIFVVALVATLLMTNFLSNGVTMVVWFNIGIVMLAGSPHLLPAFAVLMVFASCLAVLTPSATPTTGMAFDPGYITMASTWKANLIYMALATVVLAAFIPVITAVIPIS